MATDREIRAFGIFLHRRKLESALDELNQSNFPMDQVSVIAKEMDEDVDLRGAEAANQVGDQEIDEASNVATDAVNNATWGTLLVGMTSLSLFGAGPILAAGSLGAALITGVAGSGMEALAVNDLVNAMKTLGIPEDKARFYTDRVIQGNYLLMIQGSEDQIQQAEVSLSQQGIRSWEIFDATKV
ncbi:hypothetical protein C7B76_29610 [filamentous cyanobacterium CCP2]|nr:hypothetical protein C7B76_29610 [filamentous cyanobacterium CCP2]